jgi:proline racemase
LVAALAATGRLRAGQELLSDSIVGTRFTARVLADVVADGRPAVIPQVSGMAYQVGESVFTVDPDDPLVPGFVLR